MYRLNSRPRRAPMALLLSFLMALLFLSIFPAGPALAQNWAEVGDAGPLPGSSQNTAGGAISSISGTLTSDADIDMYCIRVTDPAVDWTQTGL